jgi:hypothetical protein
VAADAEHGHGNVGAAEGADDRLGRDADGQPQLNGRPRGQQAFGLDAVLADVQGDHRQPEPPAQHDGCMEHRPGGGTGVDRGEDRAHLGSSFQTGPDRCQLAPGGLTVRPGARAGAPAPGRRWPAPGDRGRPRPAGGARGSAAAA